jgi:cellulose biosynthesis protein BcsQ
VIGELRHAAIFCPARKRPLVESADVNKLPAVLKKLREAGTQWAFLDLPGRSAPVAGAGLMASDFIIVPCRPLDVDIEASVTTIRAATRGNKRYAFLMNIAPSQADKKRARQVSEILAKANHPVITRSSCSARKSPTPSP